MLRSKVFTIPVQEYILVGLLQMIILVYINRVCSGKWSLQVYLVSSKVISEVSWEVNGLVFGHSR